MAVEEKEGLSMIDCCLLFILLSSCMWCLLCVCVVFFIGNKVEFQFNCV